MVTGAYDGIIRFWKAVEQKCIGQIDFDTTVCGLSVSPNKQFLAACGYNQLRVYQISNQSVQQTYKPDSDCCFSSCLFTKDLLYSTSEDNWLKAYDSRQAFNVFSFKNSSVLNTVCQQNQQYILAGDQNGRMLQFDIRKPQEPVQQIQAFDLDTGVRHISSSSGFVACCDARGVLQIYDQELHLIHSVQAHQDQINKCKLSPNNKFVATCSCDKTCKYFEFDQQKILKQQEIQGEALDLDFNTNGQLLLIGQEKCPKLYNCEGMNVIKQYGGHAKLVTAVGLVD